MIRLALLFSILVACGGSKSPPAAPAPEAKQEQHEDHGNLPAEVKQFHEVLAPRWHAEKGPDRTKSTCDAMPDFTAGATAIAKAVPPAGADSTKWTEAAGNLASALQELDAACKSNDAGRFEPAFQAVHVAFHGVMEAGGAPHEGEEHKM